MYPEQPDRVGSVMAVVVALVAIAFNLAWVAVLIWAVVKVVTWLTRGG